MKYRLGLRLSLWLFLKDYVEFMSGCPYKPQAGLGYNQNYSGKISIIVYL